MSDSAPSEHWPRALESSIAPDDPDATLRLDPEGFDRTSTLPISRSDDCETGATNAGSRHSLGSWHEESTDATRMRFIPQTTIGRGGMGEVLLAWQPELERDVAVKVLRPDRRGEALVQALHQEAGISGRLDHPNVVPVHDAGLDYLVMRHVLGRTFSEVLTPGPPLSESIEILRKVCDGVAYAHDRGVVHRDLKPSNIMVGAFGQVLVMDWGLAIELEPRADGGWQPPAIAPEAAAAGTPSYLAPEMARGRVEDIGLASDVYLLGAILYRILAGHPPHQGPLVSTVIAAAAVNDYPPLIEDGGDLPQRLIDLQRRAMATRPVDRPPVTAFRDELVAWLRSTDSEREAMAAAGRGHRRLAEASTTREVRVAYREFARALAAFEQSLAAWDACEPARDGRNLTQSRYTRAAIANGDLALAASIAAVAERDDLVGEVHRAQRERTRARIAAIANRLALTVLILGVVIGTAGFARHAATSDQRETAQRLTEARELIVSTGDQSDDDLALQERLGRAYRAMGLAGDHREIRDAARDAVLAYGRWALAQERLDLATSLAADAAGIDPDHADVTVLAQRVEEAVTVKQRRRRELVAQRRQRLTELCTIAREFRKADLWRKRSTEEILGWDGDELRDDLIALLDDESVLVRRLAANVIGKRPDWAAAPHLLPLLDGDQLSVEQAWTSLARLADPRTAEGMRAYLLALDDDDRARELAVALPRELIPPAPDPVERPAELRSHARERLIYGDAAGYLDRMDRLGQLENEELITCAGVARWQSDDRDRARGYLRTLLARGDDDRRARALLVDLALQDDDLTTARGLIATAPAVASDTAVDPLLPRRALLEFRAGRREEASALLADLAPPGALDRRTLVAAANAHFALGHRREGRRHYAAGDQIWYEALKQMRDLATEEQHPQAAAVARLILARSGLHREALLQLAASQLAMGDLAATEAKEALLLTLDPDDPAALALQIDRLDRGGQAPLALAVSRRLISIASGTDRPAALDRHIVLARRLGHDQLAYRALAELAAGEGRPRQRWLLVRALCEDGLHPLALEQLRARPDLVEIKQMDIRDVGEPFLRMSWDLVLLGIPQLRREGWPGAEGTRLAELLLDEALVLLEHPDGDRDRAEHFARLARTHAAGSQPQADCAELVLAAAAGNRDGTLLALERLQRAPLAVRVSIGWLPARLDALSRHVAAELPLLPLATPPRDPHHPWTLWPRRPLRDCHLDPTDADLLRSIWRDRVHQLVPPEQFTLDGIEAWDARWEPEDLPAALETVEIPLRAKPSPDWAQLCGEAREPAP